MTFSGRHEIIRHDFRFQLRSTSKHSIPQHSDCSLVGFDEDMSISVLDVDLQYSPHRDLLLNRLRDAFFDIGILCIENDGVQQSTISNLVDLLPPLFDLSNETKACV
jgi:hypothetical protein